MDTLRTPHGELRLPAFLPDATRGVVRSLDACDLAACGVQGLVVNAFHLARRPGSTAVRELGGIHELMGWRRPIVSDSGGFQLFSLIRQNPKLGSITSKAAIFRAAPGRKAQHLSPEKSIQIQLRLGADILVCLDDCTHSDVPRDEQAASVQRTIAWARRCKDEFERGLDARRGGTHRRQRRDEAGAGPFALSRESANEGAAPAPGAPCGCPEGGGTPAEARAFALSRESANDAVPGHGPREGGRPTSGEPASDWPGGNDGRNLREDGDVRPLLFGVVQGGSDRELRRRCADALIEIGFDGYAYGGWPFDSDGRFLADILAYTAELLPDDKPKYALGVGNPDALVACVRMGYALFDCVLPTRDARRGRLYLLRTAAPADLAYDRLYIRDNDHHRDPRPVSDHCDCNCCRHYSRAYLHHLFAVGDRLAWRLATIHNLRFYTMLIERLTRHAGSAGGRSSR